MFWTLQVPSSSNTISCSQHARNKTGTIVIRISLKRMVSAALPAGYSVYLKVICTKHVSDRLIHFSSTYNKLPSIDIVVHWILTVITHAFWLLEFQIHLLHASLPLAWDLLLQNNTSLQGLIHKAIVYVPTGRISGAFMILNVLYILKEKAQTSNKLILKTFTPLRT